MKKIFLALFFLLLLSCASADILEKLDTLDEAIVADQKQVVEDYAFDTVQVFYATNFKLIAVNPVIDPEFFSWVFGLVTALYVLVFAYLGLQFMFSAGSLTKRTQIKADLQKAVLFAVLLVASGFIFYTALEVENYLVQLVAKPADFTMDNPLMDSGIPDVRSVLTEHPMLSFFYALSLAFSGATLAARHLIVLVCGMIFPLILFMFFTPWEIVKKTGDALLKLLAITIFLPFLDSLVVLATSQLAQTLVTEAVDISIRVVLLAFGFILIGGLNLLIPTVLLFTPKGSFIAVTQLVSKVKSELG